MLYPIGHERSLSNHLRTWSHPQRISFLRANCIFTFYYFSSHLEITFLFCLRYFRYCTHAFELQCFTESAIHRAAYCSWCVNSHEPIHGNWGTRDSDCPTRFSRFTLVKEGLQPRAPASGEPTGKAKRPKTSSSTTLVVRQTWRNKSVLLFQLRSEHFLFHVKL